MTVLITGAAGFIGFHLSLRLLRDGIEVVGYDNVNSYYDPGLKRARLDKIYELSRNQGRPFTFVEADIENSQVLNDVFSDHRPKTVVNLAAQAGVRYSIENPSAYIHSNLVGFGNVIEACRRHQVGHLIYASSSSVYGGNTLMPFSEKHNVDHPVSLYAASKKANELIAHSYSHLYGLPTTGLRFFTVYGPWGRPDMALFLFTKATLEGRPIQIFNNGKMTRDFTFIDDIIESLVRLISKPAAADPCFDTSLPNPSTSWSPYRVFNIGNSNPTPLMDYITAIEKCLGIESVKQFLPMQAGDVPATSADTTALEDWIDFKPNTTIQHGVERFVYWYRKFYDV